MPILWLVPEIRKVKSELVNQERILKPLHETHPWGAKYFSDCIEPFQVSSDYLFNTGLSPKRAPQAF